MPIAPINVSSTGDVLAAVAGKKIILHAIHLNPVSAVTIKIADKNGSTFIDTMPCAAGVGINLQYHPDGHFVTSVDGAITMTLGSGVQVGGFINYSVRG